MRRRQLGLMRWSDVPIHVIDFEGNATSGILEFGVVSVRWGEVVNSRTRLCRATGSIRNADTEVHGLKEGDLRMQAPFVDEFDFFCGLREAGPLAAHFAHVENSLLKSTWAYPRQVPDFARPGAVVADWGPWLDTGRLYAECYPGLASAQLQDLIVATGAQPELDRLAQVHCPELRKGYHAALYDALGAAVLLLRLLQRPELQNATIPWLLQLCTANPEKRARLQQTELF